MLAPKIMAYFTKFLKNYKAVKEVNDFFSTFVTIFKIAKLIYESYQWFRKCLSAATLPSAVEVKDGDVQTKEGKDQTL